MHQRLSAILALVLSLSSAASIGQTAQPPKLVLQGSEHHDRVYGVDASADGKVAVTVADFDGTVRVWALPSMTQLEVYRPAPDFSLGSAVAISPDGRYVAINCGKDGWAKVLIVDRNTDQVVSVTKVIMPVGARNMKFSPDGSKLAVAMGHTDPNGICPGVWVYDRQSGDLLWKSDQFVRAFSGQLGGPWNDGCALAWSSDGELAFGINGGDLDVFDGKGHLLASTAYREAGANGPYLAPYSLAFSPDGKRLAIGALASECAVADLRDLRHPVVWISRGEADVSCVIWGADPDRFTAIDNSGVVHNLALSDSGIQEISTAYTGHYVDRAAATPEGFAFAGFGCGYWSPSGTAFRELGGLAVSGSTASYGVSGDGSTVCFPTTGDSPKVIVFSPSSGVSIAGRTDPVAASLQAPLQESTLAEVENVGDNSHLTVGGRRVAANTFENLSSYAISPTDGSVALGGVWGVYAYDHAGTLEWHEGTGMQVAQVCYSGDGRYVVSFQSNGEVSWLDAKTGQSLLEAIIVPGDPPHWLIHTRAGYYTASPGADFLFGWQVSKGEDELSEFWSASRFAKDYLRPDVVERTLQTGNEETALTEANETAGITHRGPPIGSATPPTVRILRVEKPSESEMDIRIALSSSTDAPVESMTVCSDGYPLPVLKPSDWQTNKDRTVTVEIAPPTRPGPISVTASNKYGESDRAEEPTTRGGLITQTPSVTPHGALWYLCVGIDWPGTPGSLPELKYAAQDASAVEKLLSLQKGAGYYENVRGLQLTNPSEATSDNILNNSLPWLQAQVASSTIDNTIVIYLAGHGVHSAVNDFAFATSDYDAKKDVSGLTHVVTGAQIAEFARDLSHYGKVIILLDACNSGAAVSDTLTPLFDKVGNNSNQICLIAACGENAAADESSNWGDDFWGNGHGAFTWAILEVASGKFPVDNPITPISLYANICHEVRKLTTTGQAPYSTPLPDIPLFHIVNP